MRVLWTAALAMVALGGCAQQKQQIEEDPMIWGRLDCRRAEVDPVIAVENERVKAVCMPRAEAAAIAGTSAMPVGYGIGGAIASGISRGITSNQIATNTLASCLAKHGYLNRRRSEHDAYCAAMAPPPPPPVGRGQKRQPAKMNRPAPQAPVAAAPPVMQTTPLTGPPTTTPQCVNDRNMPDSCENRS
jgi:hypothetical protein